MTRIGIHIPKINPRLLLLSGIGPGGVGGFGGVGGGGDSLLL